MLIKDTVEEDIEAVAITTNGSEDIKVKFPNLQLLMRRLSLIRSLEDDDFDRNRTQRRRYEDLPHVKLRKQLLGLAESVWAAPLSGSQMQIKLITIITAPKDN